MKRSYLTLVLFLVMIGLKGQSTYSKEVETQIKQVENGLVGWFKINGKSFNIFDRMRYFKVKGLSIAVVQNYKITWAKGYGWANEKEKHSMTVTTLFEPGSISKSLNSVGVLKLVQDHKIDLNSDINQYLKSWKFPYDSLSKGKKITVAHLLSHTGGLSVHGFPGYDRTSKIPSVTEVLDGMPPANTAPVRSQFEPGVRFQYSGGGTTITQLIVMDVTHQPYDSFMYHNVLQPLGMVHSFYTQPPTKEKLNDLATGYLTDGIEVDNKFHIYPEQAAAGLWTTPTDLCKYIIETQLAYKGNSSKVLNREMTSLRLTPYVDTSSALGVFIDKRSDVKYFQHSAANVGFRGLYYGSLDGGNGVAIFVNSDNGTIINELLNSVASVYNWKGFNKSGNINAVTIPESIAKKYTGVYFYEGTLAEVTQKPDGIYFWSQGQDSKLYFTSDKDFIQTESIVEKSFVFDSSGNVKGYRRKKEGLDLSPVVKISSVDTLTANPAEINLYGWHLVEVRRFQDAILYLGRGIKLEPLNFDLWVNLGHAYLFNNQFDKAIEAYKVCLSLKTYSLSPKALILQDFDYLKKREFNNVLMDKVSTVLDL